MKRAVIIVSSLFLLFSGCAAYVVTHCTDLGCH